MISCLSCNAASAHGCLMKEIILDYGNKLKNGEENNLTIKTVHIFYVKEKYGNIGKNERAEILDVLSTVFALFGRPIT